MLADYVGEERFLKGVSLYLKQHLYANSVTNDLWEGMPLNITDLVIFGIDHFVRYQSGYRLVHELHSCGMIIITNCALGKDILRLMDNWISKASFLLSLKPLC